MNEDQQRLSEQLNILKEIGYSDLGKRYEDAGTYTTRAERDRDSHRDVRLLDTIALFLTTGKPGDVFAIAFDKPCPTQLVIAKNGPPAPDDIVAANDLLTLIADPTISDVHGFFPFLLKRCGANINKRITKLHKAIKDKELLADFTLELGEYDPEPDIAVEFPQLLTPLYGETVPAFASVWSDLIDRVTTLTANELNANDVTDSENMYDQIVFNANILVHSRFLAYVIDNAEIQRKWRVERLKRRLDKICQYSTGAKRLVKKTTVLPPNPHWVMENFAGTGESEFNLCESAYDAASHGLGGPLSAETESELHQFFPDMIDHWKNRRIHARLHAELRIILYLGRPSEDEPPIHAIGLSKRSCLCCALWIKLHNLQFGTRWMTSGSHGKPYPNWALPGTACVYARREDGGGSLVDDALLEGVSIRFNDALTKPGSPSQNTLSDDFISGESSDSGASLTESHKVSRTASVRSAPVTEVNGTTPFPKQPSKSPATSQLSYAEVARYDFLSLSIYIN